MGTDADPMAFEAGPATLPAPAAAPGTPREKVVGFIDIGTNSVRVLVVRISPDYMFTVLSRQKEHVRLGEGEFSGSGELRADAIERTVLVCRHFAELARSFGAREIVAVATAATREARNRNVLIERVKREAGLDVRVIPGKEEARLTYLGVSSGMSLGEKTAVFIDIGGGSTEIAIGNQHEFFFLDSLKLGALRVSTIFPAERDGRVGKKTYAAMRAYIDERLIEVAQAARAYRIELGVGSSGTIENLAAMAHKVFSNGNPRENGTPLTLTDLRRLIGILRAATTEERKEIPGMNPERADIIVGGAAILEALMEAFGLSEIRASDRGLRDGLLVDYLRREEGLPTFHRMPVRHTSVVRLARLFRVDESHANTIVRLALALFDSAREAGLHDLGPDMREILQYAAILHDVGTYLSYENHEMHSYYIIRNGALLGFSEQEIAMIAYVARYHRKYLSQKHARQIAELDPPAREAVRILANLLCLANSLDRSHTGVIRDARIRPGDRNTAVIELLAADGCALELWGLELHRKDFERTFQRELRVVVRSPREPAGEGGGA
ncbi:MAG: Ppx/GppA phosphatase family protein [Methanolinea sp.]|nr:Ppx/GppA phosphatase family protein [Methanolinea sp.]